MKKAERKDLEEKIKIAILHSLPTGQTPITGKLTKEIGDASRTIAKKFAKQSKKKRAVIKKAKKKVAVAKKKKAVKK